MCSPEPPASAAGVRRDDGARVPCLNGRREPTQDAVAGAALTGLSVETGGEAVHQLERLRSEGTQRLDTERAEIVSVAQVGIFVGSSTIQMLPMRPMRITLCFQSEP